MSKNTRKKIKEIMGELTEMLLLKNEQYGDSALNPLGIFANGSAKELIAVRMDDKISRLATGNDAIENDEDISRNVNWKLKNFEFDNLFNYGEIQELQKEG